MKNRSIYAVLTRFGIIAAVLATLVLIAPVASAAATKFTFAENGTEAVAKFTATDADGDEIEWSLNGPDKDAFEIPDGVLSFKKAPNFESPTDADEDTTGAAGDQGKGDNVYKVTVKASGGSQDVEVTVTNVDEAGSVSFTQLQPQATRPLKASFKDDDGKDKPKWQWSRGASADGPWTDISGSGATATSRTPVEGDVGSYLRATVTYIDKFGDQTASGVTDNAVEAETLANAAPKYGDIEPIKVNENVKGAIADPIVAADPDNDVLLYDLTDDFDGDGEKDLNDNEKFSYDSSGQLSLNDGLNFEVPGNAIADNAPDDDIIEYTVIIKATDPSGAVGRAEVMVHLKNVNEAPKFVESDGATNPKTLYIDEGVENPALRTTKTKPDSAETITYSANDDDSDDASAVYAVEGADKDEFNIGDSSGVLTSKEGFMADFEDKSSFSITIVAATSRGPDGSKVTKYGSLDVTIEVIDKEDDGSVSLNRREPQVGRVVLATLSDPDGGATLVKWQWYRGGTVDPETNTLTTTGLTEAQGNKCTDDEGDNPVAAGGLCEIAGATSSLYKPVAADVGFRIHALAKYTDDRGSTESAGKSSEKEVQDRSPANTAPKFPDQDLNTAGDQSKMAKRSVRENAKGEKVGEPIPADDTDNDLLMYALSGADAASFSTDDDGQITTKVKLDYEAKSEHTVVLTATDPSGAADSITVTIAVTDEDDPATITGVEKFTYAENGTEAVTTFAATDADGDEIEWSLNGKDKDDFEIPAGVLVFKKAPNFESPTDRDESDDSGDQGKGDNVYKVTVTASGGSQDVEVTVTNVDEAGSVSFNQIQPQATRGLKAFFKDDDGKDKPKWQWSRGASADGPWTDISGATTSSRNPVEGDVGSYLRATVSYTDRFGMQVASGVTDNAVEAETLANAAPKFDKIEPIEVNENVKGAIGDPIVATDPDNDVLLYDLTEWDEDGDGKDDLNDNKKFSYDSSGQLSLNDGLNFEASPGSKTNVGGTAFIEYTAIIKATDPSIADGKAKVTVRLKNVDEAPKFAKSGDATNPKTLYIDENTPNNPALRTTEGGGSDEEIEYRAEDPDNPGGDIVVTYTVEGADKDDFAIDGSLGVLTSATVLKANREKKSSYSITIVAKSVNDKDAAPMYSRLDVTIKVIDKEDGGSVSLNRREPQVGRAVLATLSDPDKGATGVKWQWYRGGPDEDSDDATTTDISEVLNDECDADNKALPSNICKIVGATSSLYTPVDDDVGQKIHAFAQYKDGLGSDDTAIGSSERVVEARNPANTAPKFPDQDLNTAGDQSKMAKRSVRENAKDEKVGEPIPADDTDNDLLTYALSGADAASFSTDNDGQIKTKVKLDYEAKSEHTVTLTATDPSGAADSITVTITVTDENDDATIILLPAANTMPTFPDGSDMRMVGENMPAGTNVGDPVAAEDSDAGTSLTYSLGGADAGLFAIDAASGQITTTMMHDYETKSSYTVNVMVDDGSGTDNAKASAVVTIGVTDAHPGCVNNDCEALLDAKGGWGGSLNWSADTDMSGWDGVTVDAEVMRVTSVNLEDKGLDGEIPAALGGLEMLTSLNLANNNLTGGIPASLGSLTNLTWLVLHDNPLGGGMPDLSGLSSLRTLWLHTNGLTGEISALPASVTSVNLRDNELSGVIPDLSGLDSLQWLRIQDNELSGQIPAEMADLADTLTKLYLAGNSFGADACLPGDLAGVAENDFEAAGLAACP